MTPDFASLDPGLARLWHVVGAADDPGVTNSRKTRLFGETLIVRGGSDPVIRVERSGRMLPTTIRYGHLWAAPRIPARELFSIPEYAETDRCNVCAATFGVKVSAPRIIENFLDMGHFPFVHGGVLGEEPHTEVKDYDIEVSIERDEIVATNCRFYQPRPSPTDTGGFDVTYAYRIPHPFCAILYKSSQSDTQRVDVIAMFVQPTGEEACHAHTMVSMIAPCSEAPGIRQFQHLVFGQDKPILENQMPKRLPLDPRAETPIRADKSGIAYRRWLTAKGITYGTIPATN